MRIKCNEQVPTILIYMVITTVNAVEWSPICKEEAR